MRTITLPRKPKHNKIDDFTGQFVIDGCYPGYGTTLGNALRRVLLSSLEGAAITSFKVKGVSHEFSTMDGIMEDAVQIMLNLKQVRFRMHSDEPVKVTLKHKGEGKITAKDIKCPSGVEVINTDLVIANSTDKKMDFEMEIEVSKGLGYVPVEQQEREDKEIGVIAVDAVYTPVKRVNYDVENMRVGKRTDYDKITLEIMTDGSIAPEEAFEKATNILVGQFSALFDITEEKEEKEAPKKKAETKKKAEKEEMEAEEPEEEKAEDVKVQDLKNISTRTLNVLEMNKISKVADIAKMTEEELGQLEGMGEKGIKEIKKAVGGYGLTLKQSK